MYMAKKVFLSENLAYLRKKQGLRQLQLAELVGVKPTTLSNYEKGISNPDLETLGRLKEVLHVSADDLVYLSPAQFQLQCEAPKKIHFQVAELKSRYLAISEAMKKFTEAQKVLCDYQKSDPIYISLPDLPTNSLYSPFKSMEAASGKMEHQAIEAANVKKF